MSQFEFVFVLFSIVAGFALTHLFGGLARTFQMQGRSLDAAHFLASLSAIFALIVDWWAMYRYIDAEWTFAKFGIHVLLFATLYGVAVTLFPPGRTDIPSFAEVRVTAFGFFTALIIVETAHDAAMGGLFEPWYLLLIQVGLVIAFAMGIALRTVRTDITVCSLALSSVVFWGVVPRFVV